MLNLFGGTFLIATNEQAQTQARDSWACRLRVIIGILIKIMTEIHTTKQGSVIISTSNKPKCKDGGDHKWEGSKMTFYNSDQVMTQQDFESLDEATKEDLNPCMCEVSCTKCGIGYTEYDNPFYS